MKVILKKKGHSFTLGRTETIYIIDTTQHRNDTYHFWLPLLVYTIVRLSVSCNPDRKYTGVCCLSKHNHVDIRRCQDKGWTPHWHLLIYT